MAITNHVVKLIHLDKRLGDGGGDRSRNFTALIDDIKIEGKLVLHQYKDCSKFKNKMPWTYSFSFTDKSITQHKDWKEIRRQLLTQMTENNYQLAAKEKVVR